MSHKTVINIGPFHPLQEEAEFFQLYVEGETVVDIDVRISYNHRGIEKLDESKTFDQVTFVIERVCGICSASHPLAYVQAVEEIAHVDVPERALYLRTIVNELERLHSHMLWVGLAGHFLGYNTVFMWAWKYREPVMDALEIATGSRVHYANCKRPAAASTTPTAKSAECAATLPASSSSRSTRSAPNSSHRWRCSRTPYSTTRSSTRASKAWAS